MADGDAKFANAILTENKFDHIVFTGSPAVGRLILGNPTVAKNLTPCTMELGGKAPAVVGKSLYRGGLFSSPEDRMYSAVGKLFRGKCMNNGQICIAPDYAIVHSDVLEPFISCWRRYVIAHYGKDPQQSEDWSRIINAANWRRLRKMKTETSGKVLEFVKDDEQSCFMGPTLIIDPALSDPVASSEIFGPILAVFTWNGERGSLLDLVETIDENPLIAYVFSNDATEKALVEQNIRSGQVMINDTLNIFGNFLVPVGGVGGSGFGNMHGKEAFRELSYLKPVMDCSNAIDWFFLYPPYNKWRKFMPALKILWIWRKWFKPARRAIHAALLVAILAVFMKVLRK
jgi:aldehyde dehydrogenase (NAD+)